MAFPGSPFVSSTRAAPRSSRRPEATMLALCLANFTAHARPIPKVAPVITAVFFSIERVMHSHNSHCGRLPLTDDVPRGNYIFRMRAAVPPIMISRSFALRKAQYFSIRSRDCR